LALLVSLHQQLNNWSLLRFYSQSFAYLTPQALLSNLMHTQTSSSTDEGIWPVGSHLCLHVQSAWNFKLTKTHLSVFFVLSPSKKLRGESWLGGMGCFVVQGLNLVLT
jgi:hypothetical protein